MEGDVGCPHGAVSFIRCYGEVYDVTRQHGVVPDLILVCVGEVGDSGEEGEEGEEGRRGRRGRRGGGEREIQYYYIYMHQPAELPWW